jgi:hypothetical protein
MLVQTDLIAVLRNTEPFFAPSGPRLRSHVVLVGIFLLSAIEVAALTVIWLPRTASHTERRPAYKNLTLATAGVVMCMWLATFTAWVANAIFHLDDKRFVTPGYFIALAAIFLVWAGISELRSGTLSRPLETDDTDMKPKA